MKWLAALLLVANAALYLWAGGNDGGGGERAAAQPDVNADGMRLLGELRPRAPVPREPDTSRNADIEPSGLDPAATPRPASSCYRIGPFKRQADWQAATRWLESQQFVHQAVRSESRQMRAVRVYLGPFESFDAAAPTAEWLTKRGVDHFAKPVDGGVRLSLGYFVQEELAERYLEQLRARGIEANSDMDYHPIGPFDWLEASVEDARRDVLLGRRWAGSGVAMIEVDCAEIAAADGSVGG